MKFSDIRSYIHGRLVSEKQRHFFPQNLPSRKILDMTLLYEFAMPGKSIQTITDQQMSEWEVEEDDLYLALTLNLQFREEATFQNLGYLLGKMISPDTELKEELDSPLFVLSSKSMTNGAVQLVNKPVLKKISDYFKDDYYILPSSVHETILLSVRDAVSYEELSDMVQTINRTEVEETDFLSDHVYLYRRDTASMEIAA